ncbi:MAG: 4'-phosphopantetheinyl transferase superfamily protein [Bacteriovoracaceae bacterium]|nr:4'-phosphopantetheinyl transferase superfamily protein [Bacteriovoracaceae bacterium]
MKPIYSVKTLNDDTEQRFFESKSGIFQHYPSLKQSHPDRVEQFILSRMALLDCLSQIGIKTDIARLQTNQDFQLQEYPQVKVSLSHTEKYGAAALSQTSKAIGIDIEYANRTVKPDIQKKITHKDDVHEHTLLEVWCLKEAGFKTFSFARGLRGMEQITIRDNQLHFENHSCSYELGRSGELYVCTTWI